jgi:hypothetical protein
MGLPRGDSPPVLNPRARLPRGREPFGTGIITTPSALATRFRSDRVFGTPAKTSPLKPYSDGLSWAA